MPDQVMDNHRSILKSLMKSKNGGKGGTRKTKRDVSKAMAIAWSVKCKYQDPGNPHCKRKPSGYFKGR